jgi:ribonuclease HII
MPCAEFMTTKQKRHLFLYPTLNFENHLWAGGFQYVAGLDEAGRGCWAGPVCAAAVILPPQKSILKKLNGVRDSKQMTPLQRTRWTDVIKASALSYGVGFASNYEIDQIGIIAATRLAMLRALENLNIQPQFLLLDFILLPSLNLPQAGLVKGDAQSLSIAAASVLAKTTRDELMIEMDKEYAGYGLARHKGYGTLQHRLALRKIGASSIHRFSFAPIRDLSLNDK